MEKEFVSVEHAEPDLAHRTSGMTDDTGQESALRSDTFLNSAFFAPESVLPHSFLLQHDEPEEIKREIPPTPKKRITIDEDTPSSPSRIGLIASMSVGILVAVFLFPMIRFAERSTRSYVTASLTSEIGRRVDQYEQINANLNTFAEELFPINLALSGWKELSSETLGTFRESQYVFAPQEFVDTPLAPLGNEYVAAHITNESLLSNEGMSITIPLDVRGFSDHKLLVLPGQEHVVRSTYGQYFHFTDARIFVRELSNLESQQR